MTYRQMEILHCCRKIIDGAKPMALMLYCCSVLLDRYVKIGKLLPPSVRGSVYLQLSWSSSMSNRGNSSPILVVMYYVELFCRSLLMNNPKKRKHCWLLGALYIWFQFLSLSHVCVVLHDDNP